MKRLTKEQQASCINIAKTMFRGELKRHIKGEANDKEFFKGYLAGALMMVGCVGEEMQEVLMSELMLATEEAQES